MNSLFGNEIRLFLLISALVIFERDNKKYFMSSDCLDLNFDSFERGLFANMSKLFFTFELVHK